MKFLKTFVNFFSTITLGILIVCTLNIYANGITQVPSLMLPQVLLAGFTTALVTTIIFSFDPRSKRAFLLTCAIHYIMLCIIMIVFGAWFGWIPLGLGGILTMVISVAAVYAFTFCLTFLLMKKEADALNKALEQRKQRK